MNPVYLSEVSSSILTRMHDFIAIDVDLAVFAALSGAGQIVPLFSAAMLPMLRMPGRPEPDRLLGSSLVLGPRTGLHEPHACTGCRRRAAW